MYAKYTYNSSSSIDNVLDDVVLLCTGETNTANLSADCDQANTTIVTIYETAPYTLYDDVAVGEQIIRVELDDAAARYKYIGITHNGVEQLGLSIMESWDAGTDTPTKEVAANYDKTGQGLDLTNGGEVHVYAAQHALVLLVVSNTDVVGEFRGDPTYGAIGVFECSRDHPSLSANDMPNWFVGTTAMLSGDSDATMDCTFFEGRDEADTVIAPLTAGFGTMGRDNAYSSFNTYLTTIDGSQARTTVSGPEQFSAEPIVVGGSSEDIDHDARTFYGDVSARCDIWLTPPGSKAVFSIMIMGSKRYIIFKTGFTASTTGFDVGGKFLVPYG